MAITQGRHARQPAVTIAIGPEAYAAWRNSGLGRVTDAIEHRLMLSLVGQVNGARVLDAGCGDGALLCATVANGALATGIDRDAAMLTAARSRLGQSGLDATLVEGTIERLPFKSAIFDVVVAMTVLCFLPDPAAALRELARVLRPGGRLVLGELGRGSIWAACRRVEGWLGSKVWTAARFRSASELRRLAQGAGLTVATTRGAVFYPPIGVLARMAAPCDPWLGRQTTAGAAFIALAASRDRSPTRD